jgi:hypothetical protein
MNNKEIDDQERIILLRRYHERRDEILTASKEIEDFRVEYITNGRQDPNGKIESEVVKRLLTIFSCLSELGASRLVLKSFQDIYYIAVRLEKSRGNIKPDEPAGHLHVCEAASTAGFCAFANLLEINWTPKKGTYINFKLADRLDSLIKIAGAQVNIGK